MPSGQFYEKYSLLPSPVAPNRNRSGDFSSFDLTSTVRPKCNRCIRRHQHIGVRSFFLLFAKPQQCVEIVRGGQVDGGKGGSVALNIIVGIIVKCYPLAACHCRDGAHSKPVCFSVHWTPKKKSHCIFISGESYRRTYLFVTPVMGSGIAASPKSFAYNGFTPTCAAHSIQSLV